MKEKPETKLPEVEEPILEKVGQTVVGKLTPKDYWEWRTTITEVEVERLKVAVSEQKLIVMQKDIENLHLRQKLFMLTQFKDEKNHFETVKNDATNWKTALEERLGFKIHGCIIDDVTHEVRHLEDEPTGAGLTNK